MTFCPDDQTNPSLCVVVVRENFFRIRRDKKAFKVLGQNEEKKNQITHATHSITLLSVFRVVFGVLYSGAFVVVFWHSPHSAMMLRESDNYDSLPGLDVFCGGLVITKLL